MKSTTADAMRLALHALTRLEWTYSASAWSPTCYWCGGYERHPAMDQDSSGRAGHTPTCARQQAIAALEEALQAETQEES